MTLARPKIPARSPSFRKQALRLRWRGCPRPERRSCGVDLAAAFPRASAGGSLPNRPCLEEKMPTFTSDREGRKSSVFPQLLTAQFVAPGSSAARTWGFRTPFRSPQAQRFQQRTIIYTVKLATVDSLQWVTAAAEAWCPPSLCGLE